MNGGNGQHSKELKCQFTAMQAWRYAGAGVHSREQEKEQRQLYGRVTWRLVPFFCL